MDLWGKIMEFAEAYGNFWKENGTHQKMVLSSSLGDIVTSRYMSIIILNEKFYFQTDKTSRKYKQMKGNCNVALCKDNIQVEGICSELGHPDDNMEFLEAYKKYYPASYSRYSFLENERLFQISPTSIQRWIYIDSAPYIETFDIVNKRYVLEPYAAV